MASLEELMRQGRATVLGVGQTAPIPGQTATRLDPSGARSGVFGGQQAPLPPAAQTQNLGEISRTADRLRTVQMEPANINPGARAVLTAPPQPLPEAMTRGPLTQTPAQARIPAVTSGYPMPNGPALRGQQATFGRQPPGMGPDVQTQAPAASRGPVSRAAGGFLRNAAGNAGRFVAAGTGLNQATQGAAMMYGGDLAEGALRAGSGVLSTLHGLGANLPKAGPVGAGVATTLTALDAADLPWHASPYQAAKRLHNTALQNNTVRGAANMARSALGLGPMDAPERYDPRTLDMARDATMAFSAKSPAASGTAPVAVPKGKGPQYGPASTGKIPAGEQAARDATRTQILAAERAKLAASGKDTSAIDAEIALAGKAPKAGRGQGPVSRFAQERVAQLQQQSGQPTGAPEGFDPIFALVGNRAFREEYNPRSGVYEEVDGVGPLPQGADAATIANHIQALTKAGRLDEAKILAETMTRNYGADQNTEQQQIASNASTQNAQTQAGAQVQAANIAHPPFQAIPGQRTNNPDGSQTVTPTVLFNRNEGRIVQPEPTPQRVISKEYAARLKAGLPKGMSLEKYLADNNLVVQ